MPLRVGTITVLHDDQTLVIDADVATRDALALAGTPLGDLTGATDGQVLVYQGGFWVLGTPTVVNGTVVWRIGRT